MFASIAANASAAVHAKVRIFVCLRARASSRGTGTREEHRAPTPRAGGGWGFERWMMRARRGEARAMD